MELPVRSDPEVALTRRFELSYARSTEPVMRTIERCVCGCDYGGNSWTTRAQADRLIESLDLAPGSNLIDLGAGTGWPGLYFAKKSGCHVTLVDLPKIGLAIALKRAKDDGIDRRTAVEVADASDLTVDDASFDVVTHSDLLCCLMPKLEVLKECRRIIRPSGRMAFSVISIQRGLGKTQYSRALANAPEFVEVDRDYASILDETGWSTIGKEDLTEEYWASCAKQVEADKANRSELEKLLGPREAGDRLKRWRSKLKAIEDGLFLREQFVCRPCV